MIKTNDFGVQVQAHLPGLQDMAESRRRAPLPAKAAALQALELASVSAVIPSYLTWSFKGRDQQPTSIDIISYTRRAGQRLQEALPHPAHPPVLS